MFIIIYFIFVFDVNILLLYILYILYVAIIFILFLWLVITYYHFLWFYWFEIRNLIINYLYYFITLIQYYMTWFLKILCIGLLFCFMWFTRMFNYLLIYCNLVYFMDYHINVSYTYLWISAWFFHQPWVGCYYLLLFITTAIFAAICCFFVVCDGAIACPMLRFVAFIVDWLRYALRICNIMLCDLLLITDLVAGSGLFVIRSYLIIIYFNLLTFFVNLSFI